jgi:hypothetical protein
VGSSYQITDGLFLLLDDVTMTHSIPGDVSLPVDRVEVVVLTETGNVRLGSGIIISTCIVRTSTEISARSRFCYSVMVKPVQGLVGGPRVSDVEEVFVRTDADLCVLEMSGGVCG